jgi:hypothetical protein
VRLKDCEHARTANQEDGARARNRWDTVYGHGVLEYHQPGCHRDMIADTSELTSRQVEIAIRYIEQHRDEVMAGYERNMERINRGNTPEIEAKLYAGHDRFLAVVRDRA